MPDTNAPLKPGDLAPDFELLNQDRQKVRLSDYRGKKKVMLLFYPMDFSPTCTQEHCTFGPDLERLQGKDQETVVFGVSTDSPYCHAAFRRQYNIPYDLLADTSRTMVKSYGMWAGEEPYNCSKRGTVVVGRDGRIIHYQQVPKSEPRVMDQLEQAALAELEFEQRSFEGGGNASPV